MSSAPTTPPSVDKVDGFSRKSLRKARQKRSQSSSQFRSQGKPAELTPLPLLKDVPSSEQPELFLKKLQQCRVIFDFMDRLSDLKMKEYKRSTLNELVGYITISRGCLTEQTYPKVVRMVAEKALYYWNNEYIMSLIEENTDIIFPSCFPAFIGFRKWSPAIVALVYNVLKAFMEMNSTMFDELTATYKSGRQREKKKEKEHKELWEKMEDLELKRGLRRDGIIPT
ncbi:hypothetical protein P7K49_000683 [Saguinus oedipus]|uniref:Uncharacterized protein n=1 Tax=Saguinus oedipus TaxID=9490 RepID=A0ABQ9WCC9_SAGOE|nr:hypothetical protein P7K49_000683 [Saguinus oedipus]